MRKRVILVLLSLLCIVSSTYAADRIVKGTVVSSEDNFPLIGASVYITATDLRNAGVDREAIGVITDIDGNFSIEVPSGVFRIFCSYIGYDVKEIKLRSDKNKYDVVLHPSSYMMDAVVVTGYQTVERRKLTAAVSKLDISEETIGAVKSIDQALAGQIAGLSVVNTTGAPGAPAKIRIRGTASMNGTQDPLWVLDGIPLEGTDIPNLEEMNDVTNMQQSSIAGINPSDIEDITILKDAAATAIYGARAANGVIVITTKKGKLGKPKISFSTRLTFSPQQSLDRLNLMNSEQKVGIELDFIKNDYTPANEKGGVYNILSANNELDVLRTSGWDGLSEESKSAINRLKTINTDWGDILFRDVFNQEYNINVSGGTERVTYYTSLGYTRENGNVSGVSMDRFNFVGKTSYKVNRMLKIGASIFANRRKNDNYLTDKYGLSNPLYYSRRANPYFEPYNAEGKYNYDYDIQNSTDKDLEFNIFEERANTSNENTINSLSAIFDGELRINEKFKLTTQFGYQLEKNSREEIADQESFSMRVERKRSKYYDSASKQDLYYLPMGGFHKAYENSNSQITWKSMFEYSDSFKDMHEVDIMIGSELRRNWYETLFSAGYGYDRKTLTTKPIVFPSQDKAKDFLLHQKTYKENAYASFFSTMSYSFLNRYTLGGSIRFDGSDLFGVEKKYRYLPLYSVSALWRLSHEPFMKNATWIDNLAIRASFGLQGNIDKNTSPFLLGKYNVGQILPGVHEDMIEIMSAPNNKLRWEKTTSYNAGFDFSVMNQRINLSADFYYRKGTDLIGMRFLPLETGFNSQTINWASMENKGVEVTLSTRNITTRDFSWYTSFNFAYNANKVLKENIIESQTIPGREGYPVGALFAFKTEGIDPETGSVLFRNPKGEKVSLTELYNLYDMGESWGFPMGIAMSDITPEEERELYTYIGSEEAPYTGGLTNTFTYKNWELSANLSYTCGGYVRTKPTYDIVFPDYGKNMNTDILNRWTPDNKTATMPGMVSQLENPLEHNWYSQKPIWEYLDIWVKKLNYARLQNLRLAYHIPESLLKRVGVNNATVALEGRNLVVFGGGYKNYLDPESMYNPYATPVPKSVIFSLNLNF